MASGSCNCGAVTFAVDAALQDVYVCHCSICRRATGANGIAVLVVPNEVFKWTGGEDQISHWRKPGHDWETWFCSVCGSPVPGHNDPERMFIPAGGITEGGESLKVAHHIFVESRACWDEVAGGGKQHLQAIEEDG